ncbi:MAG: hypothetical protein QMD22_10950 [archaeon]|nr:hypothetical protein [archaeon]
MKEEDETLYEKYPERVCYVCGRTEEDLKIIFNEQIEAIDSRIKALENEIERDYSNYREDLLKLLKDTEDTKYLELKVRTILRDYSEFDEKIPRLADLLNLGGIHPGAGLISIRQSPIIDVHDDQTLSEIREMIRQRTKDLEWFYSRHKKAEELDGLRSGKEKYGLKQVNIDFKDFYSTSRPYHQLFQP